MRVAIVHEWLSTYAGSERVLEQMIACFPKCDLFSVVDFIEPEKRAFLQNKLSKTTFIQNLPFSQKRFRQYLALMPLAVEQFDLSAYDLVISSSHAVAKGIITGPDQFHICMCYSPVRYAWDLQHQYLSEAGLDKGVKSWIARSMLHRLRMWDLRTATGVDKFIAISRFIERRIWRTYRRSSTVIYPPVDIDAFTFCDVKDDFYVTVSRMVPYKRIDLIVKAFAEMSDRKLVVIGAGTEAAKKHAMGAPNVSFLGEQSFSVVKDYLQRARAFVFAAEEDFGIAPIEAQACGTPVIAFGKGGALETIIGEKGGARTGVFFDTQAVQSIVDAIKRFEALDEPITSDACRRNAERFSIERFRQEFLQFVTASLTEWRKRLDGSASVTSNLPAELE